jgi:hypothetical protein
MRNVTSHPKVTNMYAAVTGGRVYVTTNGGTNWVESLRAFHTTTTNYLSLAAVAFDPGVASGNTVWAGAVATGLNDGTAYTGSHLFKCTGAASAGGTCVAVSLGTGLDALPVNAVKVDPGDSNTVYVATEIGLYRSTNGGTTFARYGNGLPLVDVTDIAINADGSAIRVSTFGRGFWEIYPGTSAPGSAGSGDMDGSGVIDGFDLVRLAAIEFSDRTAANDATYNYVGDLMFDDKILDNDISALIAKLGGTP